MGINKTIPAAATERIKELGYRIRQARTRRGMSIVEVAAMQERAEKAEAHLVAFREDAERYRWLRNDSLVHLVSGPICVLADKWGTPLTQHPDHNPELGPASHITLDGNKLDAAIDAARRKP